jgi:hypothetical protein
LSWIDAIARGGYSQRDEGGLGDLITTGKRPPRATHDRISPAPHCEDIAALGGLIYDSLPVASAGRRKQGTGMRMCSRAKLQECLAVGFALLLAGLVADGAAAEPRNDIEQAFAASLVPLPKDAAQVRGSIYVPAYSSVTLSQGKSRVDFSVTLSVHNTSSDLPLVIKRIEYFDTGGQVVESYLRRPIALKPFATVQIYIPVNDLRGGTGANFVVVWEASRTIADPIAETLMIGALGAGHYSFVSQGRPVRQPE